MAYFVPALPTGMAASVFSDQHESNSWHYEMRREMQEIVPHVWLGPYVCARDKMLLQTKGITHILCVRDVSEERMVRMRFPDDFHYCCIQASDSPLQTLIPLFPEASEFIQTAVAKGGSVLVHCNGGISRSPAFVVAYLMEMHQQDFFTAFQMVQNQRFCMNPIEPFKFQLKEYEPLLKARRTVAVPDFSRELNQTRASARRPYEEDTDDIVV
ncbi:hypothetical protein BSLG_002413 [Batrachochytrium salamandrivorans]|nr:hypothetical protein BSLG_002413 [Batrachochytrium salamandrivorans]